MRPVGGKQLHYKNPESLITARKRLQRPRLKYDVYTKIRHPVLSNHLTNGTGRFMSLCTGNGSTDFPRRLLPHLYGGLFAVPGGVWGADQVGGVFKRTLAETETQI